MKKLKMLQIFVFSIIALLTANVVYAEGIINGTVYYDGEKTGPVIVAALNFELNFDGSFEFDDSLDFSEILLLDTLVMGPGDFEFSGLSSGTYVLAAFLDANGNGMPGLNEPLGAYSGTISIDEGQTVTDVDIIIKDYANGSGEISGNVIYDGSANGTIHIYAFGLTTTPFNMYSMPAGNGAYNFSELSAGKYIVVGFMDINDNQIPDLGEPVAFSNDIVVVEDNTNSPGNDLQFFDASHFTASIVGKLEYSEIDSGNIYIFTVGLTSTPIAVAQVSVPDTTFEIQNLDQGEYYLFAFHDENGNEQFDFSEIDLDNIFNSKVGEPYELIAEPIIVVEGQQTQQDLILKTSGDAMLSGTVSYEGSQQGAFIVVALGLSPSWLSLDIKPVSSATQYSLRNLDFGYYIVAGIVISDYTNVSFDLSTPFGYYTKGVIEVASDDTLSGIDFVVQDSTTSTSKIVGDITFDEDYDGDIHLFSIGLSFTPFNRQVLTTERSFEIDGLRTGQYIIGGFLDVNGNGKYDFNEPVTMSDNFIEISDGNLIITADLHFTTSGATVVVGDDQIFEPNTYALGQNYPNPFNPTTQIQYQLAEPVPVTIKVFNMLGGEVRTLVHDSQTAGSYTITWDGKDNRGDDISSGVYLYYIKAGNYSDFKRMTLIR